MRISIAMYAGFFSMILLVAILSSIISYTSYSDTVQQNLEESMEFAVRMLQEDYGEYQIQSTTDANSLSAFNSYLENKVGTGLTVDFGSQNTGLTEPQRNTAKLKENFVKYLTTNLNSNITNLDVKIYGADATTGVLSAKVTATFKYPTGNVGTVSCDRTVIIDKYLKPTKY